MCGAWRWLVIVATAMLAACQSVADQGNRPLSARTLPVVRFKPWPAGQEELLPGPSSSLSKAPSLAGIAIQPPSADADPDQAAYLGEWRGWMCVGRSYDVAIAITSLADGRTAFTLAWASVADDVLPQQKAMQGQFISGSLIRILPKSDLNYGINMRLREDGALDIQRIGLDGSSECFGVLERIRGAPPPLPPVAAHEAASEVAPDAESQAAADSSLELVAPPGAPQRRLLAPPPEPASL